MASKGLFTDDEWHTLQWAVTDTMAYLSMADPGFWDTFKEATAAAKFMAKAKSDSGSPLVHDLAGDIKMGRDKAVTHDMADMAGEVVARVREAADIVAAKSPADLEAFKSFLLGVAKATAEAAKGVGDHEAAAIAKLEDALVYGLADHEVHELAGHVDLLDDLLALQEARGVLRRARLRQHVVLLRVHRHLQALAQLAVDLHDDRHDLVGRQLVVPGGPGRVQHVLAPAEQLPDLGRDVRRHGAQQQRHRAARPRATAPA